MNNEIEFSIFAPVYNEEGNLIPLFEETKKVMDKISKNWEFIFVNDASTDNSLNELKSIKDKRIRILNARGNGGQSAAMNAGFRAAKGKYVISMDADGQNDPKDIPKMFDKLQKENLDVVAGWRKKRKDPLWMLIITRTARLLRGMFAGDGVHDSGCTLRIYKQKFVKDLELWGEMHRYIIAMLRWKGAKVGELIVNHRARVHGVSKYNFTKSMKGLVDLFYIWFWKKFSARPLHLFGVGGLFLMFLGGLSLIWTAYMKIFLSVSLSDSVWFMLSFFLSLIGLQFFFTGVMLDITIRNYFNTSIESRYAVEEISNQN